MVTTCALNAESVDAPMTDGYDVEWSPMDPPFGRLARHIVRSIASGRQNLRAFAHCRATT
jgi:hypothetical protein